MGKKIKVTRSKQNEVSDGTFPVKANTQIEKSTPLCPHTTHATARAHTHHRTRHTQHTHHRTRT
jgi:phage gp45-like